MAATSTTRFGRYARLARCLAGSCDRGGLVVDLGGWCGASTPGERRGGDLFGDPAAGTMSRMRAVWGAGRRCLARRWLATAVLAVLVALAGGVVMAAIAGASRTD